MHCRISTQYRGEQPFRERSEVRVPKLVGPPTGYTAPKGDPSSFELDHIIPRSIRPELALEISLWRASHSYCNRTRVNAAVEARPVDLDW